jgi:hypothetical protein
MSPLKVNNSTVKDLSDSEEGEISNKKFIKAMIRMSNKIKQEMSKQLN